MGLDLALSYLIDFINNLKHGLANFIYEGPKSKYFRLYKS